MRAAPILALLCALPLACAATNDGAECRVGADCPSGACDAGQCTEPSSSASTGGQGGAGGSGGSGGNTTTTSTGGAGGDFCANHDFVVEQSELTLAAGFSEQLLAAQNVAFETAGNELVDGSRTWDFTASLAGDHGVVFSTLSLGGTWYESLFLGADYAARLADSEELLGVFEVATDALLLRGVVSPEDGFTRTELLYDPPVTILDFPLSEGKSWNSASTVSGLAQGVAVFYSEDYASEVDARGLANTPFGEFEVLRVHSELVRTIGVLPTTIQSHSFVAECFGSVATVVSSDDEFSKEFSQAAEVRRLAP